MLRLLVFGYNANEALCNSVFLNVYCKFWREKKIKNNIFNIIFEDNPPRIRNLPENRIVRKDRPLGLLFIVEVTDDDRFDISRIKVTLEEESPYFVVRNRTSNALCYIILPSITYW